MTRHSKGQLLYGAVLAALVAALAVLAVLYAGARGEAARSREELAVCRGDFYVKLDAARRRITEDLEQRYSADRISCEVLARRLEAQRAKDQPVPAVKK